MRNSPRSQNFNESADLGRADADAVSIWRFANAAALGFRGGVVCWGVFQVKASAQAKIEKSARSGFVCFVSVYSPSLLLTPFNSGYLSMELN